LERLVTALLMEQSEQWETDKTYGYGKLNNKPATTSNEIIYRNLVVRSIEEQPNRRRPQRRRDLLLNVRLCGTFFDSSRNFTLNYRNSVCA
jgi:hypothetical protein